MAQTYLQLVERWQGQTFLDQCTWAVLFLIRYINYEDAGTPNHANRISWANAAMVDPSKIGKIMSAMAITDPACTGDSAPTDAHVLAAVEALVNRYSG